VDQIQLQAPQNFINRELAALEFNARVLAQAQDPRVPLLERLRFLCICSSNLDEFFEIRVSGLKQLLELGTTQSAPDTLSIAEQLSAIHVRALRLIEEQYGVLNDVLLGALYDEGIEVVQQLRKNDGPVGPDSDESLFVVDTILDGQLPSSHTCPG